MNTTEALRQLVDVLDAAGLLNLSRGVELGQTVWYVKASDAMNTARAALSQSEPRQHDSEPAEPAAQAEPMAWITTRTKDGKGSTGERPCVSCNPEYVRMHHQWDWQPLYAAPPQPLDVQPVAWCALTAAGQIAYFDGEPMVMPGPVGNDCHPVPLVDGRAVASQAGEAQEQRDRAVAAQAGEVAKPKAELAYYHEGCYVLIYAGENARQMALGHRDSTDSARATSSEAKRLREALEGLVRYVERNACQHEETHRGGAIWTICDGCGKQWADDRGGFIPYERPAELVAADSALSGTEPRQHEQGDSHD